MAKRSSKPAPPSATVEALLAAIIADPDAEAPRLVYADWLLARDDPRGEFIAAQCRLAKPKPPKGLKARMREVLTANRNAWWLGRAQPGWGGSGTRFEDWLENRAWKRGFQEVVRLSADELVADGETIVRKTPLRRLVLDLEARTALRELTRALGCSALAKIRELEIYYHPPIGDAGAARLAACPHLTQLQELDVVECNITPAGARLLAASPHLARLRYLDLRQNPARRDPPARKGLRVDV